MTVPLGDPGRRREAETWRRWTREAGHCLEGQGEWGRGVGQGVGCGAP